MRNFINCFFLVMCTVLYQFKHFHKVKHKVQRDINLLLENNPSPILIISKFLEKRKKMHNYSMKNNLKNHLIYLKSSICIKRQLGALEITTDWL